MGALEAHRQKTVHVSSRLGHGRASGFNTRRHIARLARGLADILRNRCAREHWLLPGRLDTVHVWFNANRTIHECAAARVRLRGESRCVSVGRVVSCFVRSTAVRYRTVTSDRRFFRPVCLCGWQPHSCRRARRVRVPRDDMAVRRARRVFARAGLARHSTLGARSSSPRRRSRARPPSVRSGQGRGRESSQPNSLKCARPP
jgi:hypothetical protein